MAADDVTAAARAAYRVGLLDALLHSDVREAMKPAGILVRSFEGERHYRFHELESVGIKPEDLEDVRLTEEEA